MVYYRPMNVDKRDFLTGRWFRDRAVEHGGEMTVVGAIVGAAALELSGDQFYTYIPGSERLLGHDKRLQTEVEETFQPIQQTAQETANALGVLYGAWDKNYSNIVFDKIETCTPKYCTDSKGRSYQCGETCVTTYVPRKVWNDPDEFAAIGITHDSIKSAQNYYTGLSQKAHELLTGIPEGYDFSNDGAHVYLQQTPVDMRALNWGALLAYGTAGLLFANYEEMAQYAENHFFEGNTNFANERIGRRTFLKLMGGAGAAAAAWALQRRFAYDNESLRMRLEKKIGESAHVLALPLNDQMKLLLDSPANMQSVVAMYERTYEQSLVVSSTHPDDVANALQEVSRTLENTQQIWDEVLLTLPPEVGKAVANLWATQNLKTAAANENSFAGSNHVLGAIAVGAMLLGFGTLTEKALLDVSDRLVKRIKE